jgi:hypothetical protein
MTYDDRRRWSKTSGDVEMWVSSCRVIRSALEVEFRDTVIATIGERIELRRRVITGSGPDGNAFESELLLLTEVDDEGKLSASINFEPDAHAEAHLEARRRSLAPANTTASRSAAPERLANAAIATTEHVIAAMIAHDWQAFARLFADDFRMSDRRRMVQLELDREQYFAFTREVADGRTVRACSEVVATRGERLALTRRTYELTEADHGPSEIAFLILMELGEDGRIANYVRWDVDDIDAAHAELMARFAEIGDRAGADPLAVITRGNAATAAIERWQHVLDGGVEADWDAVRASCAPGLVFEDRQGFAHVAGDRELMIASLRERAASSERAERDVVAIAGEHVAVTRMLWSGGPPGGRFEIEYLGVTEVDEAGLLTASILFGADDERAALGEAWARWARIDRDVAATLDLVAGLRDAFDRHDEIGVRALCADDLAYADHRRSGAGRLAGADAYVASVAALWQLAPATGLDVGRFWPAYDRHGAVTLVRRSGKPPDDGRLAGEYLQLFVVARGRATHIELFEIEDLDGALARFVELRAEIER